jgi:hypothetical protein
MHLWRLQAGDPGKPVLTFQSKFKGLRIVGAIVKILVQWEEKSDVLPDAGKQEGGKSFLPLLFAEAINRLNDACPHWGGQSIVLSPLIQKLISYRNTFTPKPFSPPEITFHLGPIQ